MKLVNVSTLHTKDEVLSFIKDNNKVNDGVRFDDKYDRKPLMHIKENDGKLQIKCEMIGGPTKDNGFLAGTVFRGRITERDGVTTISGLITTSVIYHIALLALIVLLFVQMFLYSAYGLISVLVFAVGFELMFFKDEFKKQGYIKRYLERAVRRLG
jgi:hypothetical protein